MKIGIDIDDTIANTFETGMKYAQQFTRKYCNRAYTDINKRLGSVKSHRHWQTIFEWNSEEEIEFFKRYYKRIVEEVDVKEEVCDVINQLYLQNEIIFITARFEVEGERIEELTKRWLRKNNIPFHQLYLGRKKSEVCQKNQIDIFIDDSYENCKSVQVVGTKVYLMDHTANRNIEDKEIERVYGWNDLYRKMQEYKEGKLDGNYHSYSS